jgi:hypothetical protein
MPGCPPLWATAMAPDPEGMGPMPGSCGCSDHSAPGHSTTDCFGCGFVALAPTVEIPEIAAHSVRLPIRPISPLDGRILPWRPPA